MNKSKTIQKIELIVMILMLVCAVTMLSIHAVQTAQKDAEKFTWQEIKDTIPIYRWRTLPDVIYFSISKVDDDIRGLHNNEYYKDDYYGMIAVIKVKKSRNILATWHSDYAAGHVKLSEIKEQTLKLHHTEELIDHSAVVTDAEILEVLYQPPGKFYHRGQTVRLRESYFIIDQRVPHILRDVHDLLDNQSGESTPLAKSYAVMMEDYIPLEESEIYLVYTSVNLKKSDIDDYNGAWNTDIYFRAVCLSDPQLTNNARELEWVVEKYNLSKYMK